MRLSRMQLLQAALSCMRRCLQAHIFPSILAAIGNHPKFLGFDQAKHRASELLDTHPVEELLLLGQAREIVTRRRLVARAQVLRRQLGERVQHRGFALARFVCLA